MYERAYAHKRLVAEVISDVDVLEAHLVVGEAHVYLGVPFPVAHLGSEPHVGDRHSILEKLLLGGGIERPVEEYASGRRYLEFRLVGILGRDHSRA